MGWKQDFANEAEKAWLHPMAESVIDEFEFNMKNHCRDWHSVETFARYGIRKVCTYVAQVARAQALGIDPEVLRMNDEEIAEHMRRLIAMAEQSGNPPIIVVTGDEREGGQDADPHR